MCKHSHKIYLRILVKMRIDYFTKNIDSPSGKIRQQNVAPRIPGQGIRPTSQGPRIWIWALIQVGARQQISLLCSFLLVMGQGKADAAMENRKRVTGEFLRWHILMVLTGISDQCITGNTCKIEPFTWLKHKSGQACLTILL